MNNNKKMILGIALIAVGIGCLIPPIYAAITMLTVHNDGTIGLVNAFAYDNATVEVNTLHWSNVLPDSVQTKTLWLKNFGSIPVNITLTTDNWNPPNANTYLQLSWDREGYTMPAGFVLQATFTLTAFANSTAIPGSFSFDFHIHEAW